MSDPIHFVVPVKPVGVNASYVRRSVRGGGKGLMKTREAKAFTEAIAMTGRLARAGVAPMDGPVSVTIAIYFADERPDIDGPLKPILDAMQAGGAGIYMNDRQVKRLLVERDVDRERPRVEVWVEPFRKRVLPFPDVESAQDRAAQLILDVLALVRSRQDRLGPAESDDLVRMCAAASPAGSPTAPAKREFLSLRASDLEAELRRRLAASRRIRSSKVDHREPAR